MSSRDFSRISLSEFFYLYEGNVPLILFPYLLSIVNPWEMYKFDTLDSWEMYK